MTIVAFMQCQWFPGDQASRVEAMLARKQSPEQRSALIKRFLFHKCLTGRRLRSAFGDLVNEITWEESTTRIATESSGVFPPDPHHIHAVIGHFQPDVILTFGQVATDAVKKLLPLGCEMIYSPHPAARQHDTMDRVHEAADQLRSFLAVERKRKELL